MKLRMNNRFAALSAVWVLVWSPGSGRAATWYVEAGSSGTGTQQDPFGTIQEGMDAAQPGDEVVVSAGTYNESVTWTPPSGTRTTSKT